ncbi:MAG: EAL domain-containing protein [Candidatus Omnitrophica bacterium]|nr:EAL domain-containing protein [Candidatus Omnitrophota bacterium]
MTESSSVPIQLLLIDKDETHVKLIRSFARQVHGPACDVQHVTSLKLALSAGRPDLILTSLELPDSRGIVTLNALREKHGDLPIIILTSPLEDDPSLKELREDQHDHLVIGKFDLPVFSKTIRFALERSRILRERDDAHQKVLRMSTSDPLTGLLNRQGLETLLQQMVHSSQKIGRHAFAFLMNLDNFKAINDTFGHAVGDLVLKEMGCRIQSVLQGTGGTVARISGDEFMVMLSGLSEEVAVLMAERVRLVVSQSSVGSSEGQNVFVTASIGLVELLDETSSVDHVLQRLRYTISRSKKTTRKNSVTYQKIPASGKQKESEGPSIDKIIDVMVSGKGFYSLSQPLVDMENMVETGREYFGRFSGDDYLMPDDFFRIAREAKILTVVDRACLKVCVEASLKHPKVQAHMNLFPSTLMDISPDQLIREFSNAGDISRYCIEISEQQVICDPSHLVGTIRALRNAGISIAIDDVGFGRSCLESLILLEPDVVKIDKRWIHGIHQDPERQRLLKRLIHIIESCESQAVAEGIETEGERQLLLDFGVRIGQGYLFGRPGND